ncbi:MAG: adenylate/guanylate cyclase domain-containing protein [Jatrophihabitans sp.]|nr:MAG: adenylate/guanylate cyclase domain-containing protein [Jatrophihabitans sp.]
MIEAAGRAARPVETKVTRLHQSLTAGQVPLVVRSVVGMAVLAVAANVIGAIVVGLLVLAVNPAGTSGQRTVLITTSVVDVLASVLVGTSAAVIMQRRTLRWVLRGTEPDAADARRAVRMPVDLAIIAAVIWGLDTAVMGIAAAVADAPGHTIFGICGGMILAGLCSSGVTYLIVARLVSPITRAALTAHPPQRSPILSLRYRLLLIWLLTSAVPVLGILVILLGPGQLGRIRTAGVVTAVIALTVGLVSTALMAQAIGTPLRGLSRTLEQVGSGDLDCEVEVADPGEIGLLQSGVNDMMAGLRDRDRLHDLFGRHVGPAVAAEALRSGVTLSGELRSIVALFVDITGSTSLTLSTEPGAFVAMLNRFFEIVVAEVEGSGGLVNKFEGDGALCIFGAPVALIDAETSALRAARAIRDRVEVAGEVAVGIGVASGTVVAGQVGAPSRLEYTVIGDAVNEAARLTDVAKGMPGSLLASAAVVERASPVEREHWREGDTVALRGRAVPTRTWFA